MGNEKEDRKRTRVTLWPPRSMSVFAKVTT